MKKLAFLFMASAMVFSGCSNDDDDPAPVASTPPVLVKKTIETYSDGSTITSTYAYNGNKLTSITKDSSTDIIDTVINYVYTGDNITSIDIRYDNSSEILEAFTYDASGRLSTFVETGILIGGGYREVYGYNADGTVSISSFYGDEISQTNPAGTGKVFFTAGEVTKIETYTDNGSGIDTEAVTYMYDDKNSIYKDVAGYSKLAFYNGDAFGVNRNITKETTTYSDGSPTDILNYIYAYNGGGFPTTSSQPDPLGGGTLATQYFYE